MYKNVVSVAHHTLCVEMVKNSILLHNAVISINRFTKLNN
ncbi:hypothetical protein ECH_0861 [Ehrlichia chaffeensis str. Arkansas]|uniref:Uncharacterized protein n=1 Tax=Ehrlichia chaffeensis (strain ATCC CRL-10679 / Arkansas) TaxID=205920 RepID=Q2GFX7_EHRCR|nr:hypothetical protein ECH_0861 [Ehrlichia chaffeensis str. Arkansas]AHX07718.1 hypothetical protein ECHOSC_0773 [Ehrlichia chaffeensis str. Osceola]